MRKIVLFVVAIATAMICTTTGCTNKKPEQGKDSVKTDSVATADSTEEIDSAAKIIAETPMPKAADQLFDDFFFNFIANPKIQYSRIKFPLPETEAGKTKMITKNEWKMQRFFRPQGYYTLIFDDEKQVKLAQATDLDTVIVESIRLQENRIKQYIFDHQDGYWKLNKIRFITFKDSYNASFYKFLATFFASNGKGFVPNQLAYTGPDPNGEETATINTTVPGEEWSSFLPEVPQSKIYNILYGQKYSDTNMRIITFRGLSNGVETELVFKKNGNSWKLNKINAF